MVKIIKNKWKLPYDSIQEPSPHHTVYCLKCGALYNRTTKKEKTCKVCKRRFKRIKMSEFYVGKTKIHIGKDLETRRGILE